MSDENRFGHNDLPRRIDPNIPAASKHFFTTQDDFEFSFFPTRPGTRDQGPGPASLGAGMPTIFEIVPTPAHPAQGPKYVVPGNLNMFESLDPKTLPSMQTNGSILEVKQNLINIKVFDEKDLSF